MAGPVALVRAVPSTFPDAVTGRPPQPALDVGAARAQHEAYVHALESRGFAIRTVAADDAHPDCCFIEDAAVVIDGRGLLTNPGHPSRRGEVGPVGSALRDLVDVEVMAPPATLDGGDVLQVGAVVFVGVGGRSNREGFDAVARFAAGHGRAAVPVTARGVLHLKSAATALDAETILAHPGAVDPEVFVGFRVVAAPEEDAEGANVVRLPDGSVLVAAHHRRTAELVESLGHGVVAVDVGEFARAEGGLTCLSIRVRHSRR